ncbi:MAG: DUF3160 domain-containing protein [Patescibacteria group bacterium]
MFEEHLPVDSQSSLVVQGVEPEDKPQTMKKLIRFLVIDAIILVVAGAGVYGYSQYKKRPKPVVKETPVVVQENTGPTEVGNQLGVSPTSTEIKAGDFLIEQVSFKNYYQAPANDFKASINDYTLPINIKTDVVNYFDVSRKLDLTPLLPNLNQNGFVVLENPDPKNNRDFYSSYTWLQGKGLPILITSDLIAHHYQNNIKLSFKEVEEDIFYQSLSEISQELYDTARARYEGRLSKIGKTNDQLLEGERLELAFFAVAIQLLQQPDKDGKFVFSLPDYLKDDVVREMSLIRAAKGVAKSPVLLYSRDYADFNIPAEYRSNPKLNNFYLTAKWLNSVFPLYYEGKDCPTCQLDEIDWHVNLTAASFIAHDFYQSYKIKNQWARVYKTLTFFKGLREDLTYLDYQKVLESSFGSEYDLEGALGAENPQSSDNFNKLRSNLLALNFPEWSGGFSRADQTLRPKIGFRTLADFYSANDFLAAELTSPKVSNYQGGTDVSSVCPDGSRCRVLPLDIINLISSFPDPEWIANTNYKGFKEQFLALKNTLGSFTSWQTGNYWSNLNILKNYLESPKGNLPIFGQNNSWKNREISLVKALWLNLQSSVDPVKVMEISNALGERKDLQGLDYYYVEPNLALIDSMIADNKMFLGMYQALEVQVESPRAYTRLEGLTKDLEFFRATIVKELSGQALSVEEAVSLGAFVNKYQITPNYGKFRVGSASLNYNFEAPKFLLLVFKTGDKKALTIGPVFSYSENR